MRMMMRALIPTESGNRIIEDGTIQKVVEETMTQLQPEAAYFLAENGNARQAGYVVGQTIVQSLVPIGSELDQRRHVTIGSAACPKSTTAIQRDVREYRNTSRHLGLARIGDTGTPHLPAKGNEKAECDAEHAGSGNER